MELPGPEQTHWISLNYKVCPGYDFSSREYRAHLWSTWIPKKWISHSRGGDKAAATVHVLCNMLMEENLGSTEN